MEDRQKAVSQILKELKEDYPDFNVGSYRKAISDRLASGDELEDITEMELFILNEDLEWEEDEQD